MRCEDAQEFITALVDNELSLEERRNIEGHLDECQKCRLQHERERLLKQEIKLASASVTMPVALREKIRGEIENLAGDARAATGRHPRRWLMMPALRPAFALTLLLLVILPLAYQWWATKNVALAALETHEAIMAEKKTFTRSNNAAALKKQLGQAVGNKFAPMGYDLSGMNIYPVGGFVEVVAGREVVVTVYQGEGPAVTCFTFLGSEADAPKGARLFHDPEKQMNFYSFSRDGVNGVLHKEGETICIMVSKIPLADLLAMVREKVRPA